MSSKVFKLFNLVLLLALVLSACTQIYDPNLPAPEEPQDPVSEKHTSIDPDAPDQPIFGDEIYNGIEACADLAQNQICLGPGVYFEEVRRHAGVDAAHAYGGFMARLTAWCEHHQIPYQGVPVGTIKKSACGKGNASKEEMVEKARAIVKNVSDHNEADAIHILMYAINNEN